MKIKRGVRRRPRSFAEFTFVWIIGAAIVALTGCSAGAGGGNSGNDINVTITNKVASVQAGTGAVSFSATVQNDSSNSGVTWSLTANGGNCSPSCGSLSAATSTNVTYTPPASAGASPNNQPTLTATSVAKTNRSDSDTFTVSSALIVTITNKFSTINAGASSFVVSATVQNDSSNSGVTWTLTANGSACSPACGSLSGSTTTSATYTPPSTVPGITQAVITATSVHDTTKSDSDTFTINPIIVTISSKFASVNAGASAFVVNATVQNDSTNSGVSWMLTTNGAACSAACGALSGATASSVTYAPPSTVPAPPNITLIATSVHDNSKSDSDSFTVVKAPISVTIGNKVSTVYAHGSAILFSANVYNDAPSQPNGVSWALTSNGSSCSPACGTISANQPGQSSTIYTPPSSVPTPATATLTAVSNADGTKSDFDAFTITALPPVSVTVSQVTSVLAGGSGITFSANIQNDPSSTPSVTWTLSGSGSLMNNQPTTVTYVPPAAPASSVQITATSTFDATKSGSDVFSVTSGVSSSCGAAGGQESLLTGQYAMLVQGFWGSGSGTPILIAASFTANGSGGITGGEEDVNDTISPQHLTFDSAPGHSLYTVGPDHRGCLQLTNSAGATAVFRFSVGGISSGVASKGRIIEFDDNSGTGAGYRGSGILRLQDITAFMPGALKANYAFGVGGWTQSGNQWAHLGAAGSFSNSGGSLSGVLDENIGGILFPETTGVTGNISAISSTTGRAVANFPQFVFDWAMYIVNSSEFFLIGTDAANDNPVSFGMVIATGNSFSAAALSGNYVLHATGDTNGSADVDLELLTMTPGGAQAGTLSGTVYSYGAGTGAQTTPLSGLPYNVDPTLGRTTLGNTSNNLPILYVTTPTDNIAAFVMGVGADAIFGVAELQTGQSVAAGTYIFGTEDPGDNTVTDKVGVETIASGGGISATYDQSSASGLLPGQMTPGTVSLGPDGTGNVGTNTVAITSGSKLFSIDETGGTNGPAVIVVAEQ